MGNNHQPNIIFLCDLTSVIPMEKTLGPYKVAHQLRTAGFEVTVVHHLSVFTMEEIEHLLVNVVNDKTLFVGVNNFFYKNTELLDINDDGSLSLTHNDHGSILPHGSKYNTKIKNLIKTINPNCKLVVGGPNAADIEYNKIFDYVILGYSEISIVNLAQHLFSNDPLNKSRKSVYGFTIIDDSLAPEYDFTNNCMRYEDHDGILPGETLTLEIARGCIFKCAFCGYPMNGKKKLDFIRSQESLYNEIINNYERFGTTRYVIIDDTLNDSPEKCEALYNLSKKLPFQMEWWAYLRLDLLVAHTKTIDMLWQSGMRSAFYGIETLNSKTGSIIGKGGNRDKLIKTIEMIKSRYGNEISQHGSFIYGLPHESRQSLQQTTEWLLDDDNPLDSWQCLALMIRDPSILSRNNGFVSDIDRNWKKYGYRDSGKRLDKYFKEGVVIWENDHFDFTEVVEWVSEIEEKGRRNNNLLPGRLSIAMSGLGVPLSSIHNKPFSEIDWHTLDQLKLAKANEYKEKIFRALNVPPLQIVPELKKTFSEFLTSQIRSR